MENKLKLMKPEEVQFKNLSRNLDSDKYIARVREMIFNEKIVILKQVFSEDEMIFLKNEIIKWGKETPIFPHGESPSNYPSLNYHRIDDGSVPSVCPHIFHQFGFNSIEELNADLKKQLLKIAHKLKEVQNLFAETTFDISLSDLRLKVLHYPEGGGFLEKHDHPLEPQRIGLILSLSKKSQDFIKGGTAFETTNGYIDTAQFHDIGDIILFKYNVPHEVTPVNPEKESIDWSLPTGKWSVVLELRDTHNLSHQK